MIPDKTVIDKFLASYHSTFMQQWQKKSSKIKLTDEKLTDCGEEVYHFFSEALLLDKEVFQKQLSNHAEHTAETYLHKQLNIGDFIYQLNIGREIFIHDIEQEFASCDHIQIVNYLSELVNLFTYYIITFYTDYKNAIIKEKNEYITSTHSERLTVLGRMTSSFVHEFRNPLTSIHGFIQLLKAENPHLPYLEIITNELEQLKFSISQFLLLSKKEIIETEKVPFYLNHLVDQVLSFLYPKILEVNVEILKNFNKQTEIIGYQDEIRQVVVNIVFNAVDVLVDIINPVINIQLESDENYIHLSISNNGPRIPESLLDNIFDPFVTTKKTGTGLGLYVCKKTMEKHNGMLTCTSDDDWTVFTMSFPVRSLEQN